MLDQPVSIVGGGYHTIRRELRPQSLPHQEKVAGSARRTLARDNEFVGRHDQLASAAEGMTVSDASIFGYKHRESAPLKRPALLVSTFAVFYPLPTHPFYILTRKNLLSKELIAVSASSIQQRYSIYTILPEALLSAQQTVSQSERNMRSSTIIGITTAALASLAISSPIAAPASKIANTPLLNIREGIADPPVLNARDGKADPPVLNAREGIADPPVLNARDGKADPPVLNA